MRRCKVCGNIIQYKSVDSIAKDKKIVNKGGWLTCINQLCGRSISADNKENIEQIEIIAKWVD